MVLSGPTYMKKTKDNMGVDVRKRKKEEEVNEVVATTLDQFGKIHDRPIWLYTYASLY